jgi:WD40 repeat protein
MLKVRQQMMSIREIVIVGVVWSLASCTPNLEIVPRRQSLLVTTATVPITITARSQFSLNNDHIVSTLEIINDDKIAILDYAIVNTSRVYTLTVLDFFGDKQLEFQVGLDNEIIEMRYASPSNHIAFADHRGYFEIWDLSTLSLVSAGRIPGLESGLLVDVAFTPDLQSLIVPYQGYRLLNIPAQSFAYTINSPLQLFESTHGITALALAPSGSAFAYLEVTGSENNLTSKVHLIRTADGSEIGQLQIISDDEDHVWLSGVAVSQDANWVVVNSNMDSVLQTVIWDVTNGTYWTIGDSFQQGYGFSQIELNAEISILMGLSDNPATRNRIVFANPYTGELLSSFRTMDSVIHVIDMSEAGTYAAALSSIGTVTIWQII